MSHLNILWSSYITEILHLLADTPLPHKFPASVLHVSQEDNTSQILSKSETPDTGISYLDS